MTVAPIGAAAALPGVGGIETAPAVVPAATGPAGPTPAEELGRGSFRDAFAVPRPAASEAIGNRIMEHLDRIEARRQAPATEAAGRTDPSAGDFERHMQNLERSFNYAIEVELASKTSTSLASSMNKLMSGN